MAISGNMWLYDDGGALIKGGCDGENVKAQDGSN